MRAREFIKEADPSSPQNIGSSAAKGLAALAGNKPTTTVAALPGTQPKPLQVKADPVKPSSTVGTSGTTSSTPSSTQPQASQQQQTAQQQPAAAQQTPQQQQQTTQQQQQDQMRNDALVMAQRMGMTTQQSQQFADKILGTGSQGGASSQKTLSPQDMQKAMPKPGDNLTVKKLGTAKVLPTPGDEKGIKLDTTSQLGYPILVDPRDVQP